MDLIERQAAIDAVRELYIQSPKINNDIVYDMAIDQAHDALINLPSAQPETNCSEIPNDSDTISRQAAIDAVLKPTYADGAYGYADAKELVDSLEALPSAQPERKTGRWIYDDNDWSSVRGKCSVCRWEAHVCEDDVVGMDYCPNCGSRLLIEKDGE